MILFLKRAKIPQQKWYHFRKGPKFLNKNGTISEKGQNSSSKMVPFQKMVKIPQKNGTISGRKGSQFLKKMVPFQKIAKITQQKWYHFRKESKILNKNGIISEKGQNS